MDSPESEFGGEFWRRALAVATSENALKADPSSGNLKATEMSRAVGAGILKDELGNFSSFLPNSNLEVGEATMIFRINVVAETSTVTLQVVPTAKEMPTFSVDIAAPTSQPTGSSGNGLDSVSNINELPPNFIDFGTNSSNQQRTSKSRFGPNGLTFWESFGLMFGGLIGVILVGFIVIALYGILSGKRWWITDRVRKWFGMRKATVAEGDIERGRRLGTLYPARIVNWRHGDSGSRTRDCNVLSRN